MPRKTVPAIAGVTALALAAPATAGAPTPEILPLPNAYQPEGIAKYDGDEALVGSIPTGALTRVNVKTGERTVLAPPTQGRAAIGLKVADGRVYVAGGPTGKVRVHDAQTGEVLREEQAADPAGGPTFVNDVTVTKDAAFFTDSRRPVLYVLPTDGGPLRTLPVTGDFQQLGDPATTNNLNGIVATGKHLIAVSQGRLFRIDRETGVARTVTLTGAPDVLNGDGLLLEGKLLSVVQNRQNKITQFRVSKDRLGARLQRTLTDPDFAVPTTVARIKGRLYAPNAKFGTAVTPETPYEVVKVDGSQGKPQGKAKGKGKRGR
jgi:hypothetical protein